MLLRVVSQLFLLEGQPGRPLPDLRASRPAGASGRPSRISRHPRHPASPGRPLPGSPPRAAPFPAPVAAPLDRRPLSSPCSRSSSAMSTLGWPPPNRPPNRPPRCLPICFIMSAICRCILSRRLISCTSVPEPLATRFLREALSTLGLRRSNMRHRADDRHLPLQHELVEIDTVELLPDLAHAGQQSHHARHAAKLLQLPQLIGEVVEIEGALLHARGDLSALSASISSAAFSTRLTTSPMPRIRPAIRSRMEILEPVQLLARCP